MSARHFLENFVFTLCLFCFSSVSLSAADAELTERLFFQPIEKVITAGRTEQTIERAPATVSVISASEIKASGALTIPEVLRFVPGLDVMTISASHAEVNARGLNQLLSNKTLVLIDGRSVYFDFFGGVVWEGLPVLVDQIDRIEVVRSPSSALYGANAFSGVINIITKTPRQLKGVELKLQGGEDATLFASAIAGQQFGSTGYRIALGSRKNNSLVDPHRNSENVQLGNIYLGHRFHNDTRLSFETGLSDGNIEQIVRSKQTKFDGTTTYSKLNLEKNGLKIQAFWNHGKELSEPFFPGGSQVNILYNTVDFDAQNARELGGKNTLIYGASYRLNTVRSSIIDHSHSQNLLAGYFQDEYRPLPELSLLAGIRVDHHPLVGTNVSPRGSVIFSPRSNQTFRFSLGQAFRNPSFTDSYFSLLAPGDLKIQGATDLKSEKITTWELGYTFFPSHTFRAELDFFTWRFRNYIGTGSPYPAEDYAIQSFVNLGSASSYGFELTADYLPVYWLKLSANYSYQSLNNHYTVLRYQHPPVNKINLKSFVSLPSGIGATFIAGFVGSSKWEQPEKSGDFSTDILNSHLRCDARLAWEIKKLDLEVFAAALDVFNTRRLEYPLAEKIGRRLTAGFNYGF